MKKVMLTALAIVMMTVAAFAGNTGGPHTKQYLDIKEVLDQYENNIKSAESCDDLESAELMFFFSLLASIEDEYDEAEMMTDEESDLISEQADRIEKRIKLLQQYWGCETEDDSVSDYEKVMSALDELESAINSARSCDELNDAVGRFLDQTENIDGSTFTDDESDAFTKKSDRIGNKLSNKADILCD